VYIFVVPCIYLENMLVYINKEEEEEEEERRVLITLFCILKTRMRDSLLEPQKRWSFQHEIIRFLSKIKLMFVFELKNNNK